MAVEQRSATAELAELLSRFRREAEAASDRAALVTFLNSL